MGATRAGNFLLRGDLPRIMMTLDNAPQIGLPALLMLEGELL